MIPAMVSVAAVLAARAQPPPGSVMVTCWPLVAPVVAAQLVNPDPKVTGGEIGMTNPGAKVTVMVFPVASAPVAVGVKPTVQTVIAPVTNELGEKVTPLGELPITTGKAGIAGVMSWEVATVKVLAG